mgnify:CR=1 FL=1
MDEKKTDRPNFDAIVDFLFEDDRVRGLLKTIKSDGAVNDDIIVYKEPDDGSYRVLEGNCRLAVVTELGKRNPRNKNWKQIPAILLPENMPWGTKIKYSIYAHVVGKNDWTPFQYARHLLKLRNTKVEEGMNKQEALEYVYDTIKVSGTSKAAVAKEIGEAAVPAVDPSSRVTSVLVVLKAICGTTYVPYTIRLSLGTAILCS